jgi:fibronectin-binding autotransporter adhesin
MPLYRFRHRSRTVCTESRQIVACAQALEPRDLFAAVSWDGGGGNFGWTTPDNWSNNALPTSADDVTIDIPAAITVTISSGAQSINSLTCAENLTISGGSLTLAAPSSVNGNYAQSGTTTLAGAGDLSLNGLAAWTGGTMSGAGKTIVGDDGTLILSGSSNLSLGRSLDINGICNWSGTADLLMTNATVSNNGTINHSTPSSTAIYANTAGTNALINNGTINMTGIGTIQSAVPATNAGSIAVTSGTFAFEAASGTSLTNTGAISVAAGTTLRLRTTDFSAGGSVAGAGTIAFPAGGTNTVPAGAIITSGDFAFTGGTVTLNLPRTQTNATSIAGSVTFNQPMTFANAVTVSAAGIAVVNNTASFGAGVTLAASTSRLDVNTLSPGVTVPSLTITGGTIGGSGLLVIAGTLNATGTSTMDGTGTTRLAAGGAWTPGTTVNLSRTFDNTGTVTQTVASTIRFRNGILLNHGTWTVGGVTATRNFLTDLPGSTNLFVNNGTFNQNGTDTYISVPLQHNGVININAGENSPLFLNSDSVYSPASTIAGPGAVYFEGGTHVFQGSTTLGSLGRLVFLNGTTTFNTNTILHDAEVYDATLNGPGTITVGGTIAARSPDILHGFNLGGGGRFVVPAGATFEGMTSALTVGRPFDNAGTMNFSGEMRLNASTLTNTGTLAIGNTFTRIQASAGFSVGTLVNNGLITTTSLPDIEMRVPFDHHGTFDLNGGRMIVYNGFADGTYNTLVGTYDIAGLLNFPSSVITNAGEIVVRSGGTLGSNGAGIRNNNGILDLREGVDMTITPNAPLNTTRTLYNRGMIALSAGSVLTIEGAVQFAGAGNSTLRSEIAGAAPADYGRLVATLAANLDSPDGGDSQLDPDLAAGYDPPTGARFNIVTGSAVNGAFDDFLGTVTPSGKYLVPGQTATQFFAEVGTSTPPAPQVVGSVFEFATRQAIVLTFSTNVGASVSRSDFSVLNQTTGMTVSNAIGQVTYDANTNAATLTLTNLLPDGNYRLTIAAADISNAVGVPLTNSVTLDFFVLAGDANRDRHVDFADLVILAQNYNLSGRNFGQGDFNYSGTVDFADLVILAQKYNSTLALLPAEIAATSKPRKAIRLEPL